MALLSHSMVPVGHTNPLRHQSMSAQPHLSSIRWDSKESKVPFGLGLVSDSAWTRHYQYWYVYTASLYPYLGYNVYYVERWNKYEDSNVILIWVLWNRQSDKHPSLASFPSTTCHARLAVLIFCLYLMAPFCGNIETIRFYVIPHFGSRLNWPCPLRNYFSWF